MPFRFQVNLPGPFVWQSGGGDTGGTTVVYSGPVQELSTAERIELAQENYDNARRVCRWLALAWAIWSGLWVVVWLLAPAAPWSAIGYSIAAWVIGAALILRHVRSEEDALNAELDRREAGWAADLERERLIREADEGHARWRDTL